METTEFNEATNFNPPKPLPNATLALVLGIVSIPTCCFFGGLLGLVLGVVAIVFANKAIALYNANQGMYQESGLKNAKAGRICAIIGIVFSLLMVLMAVWMISTFGWDAMNNPEDLQKQMEEYFSR